MRRMLALVFAVSVSLGMLAMAQTGGGSSSMDKACPLCSTQDHQRNGEIRGWEDHIRVRQG